MPAAASFSLLPATLDDAAFAADVYTDEWPDEPSDPVMLRHEWALPGQGPRGRYLVVAGGRRAGFCQWQHDEWDQVQGRYGLILAAFFRAEWEPELVAGVIGRLEGELRSEGALILSSQTRPYEQERIGLLRRLGYVEDREERWWELDLGEAAPRLIEMAASSRRRAAEAGVELVTLQSRAGDDAFLKALWQVSVEADQDIPTTIPIPPESYETFLADLKDPSTPWDRVWVAVREGLPLGMSLLHYPPQRGNVWTAWTCTARSARGQGLARALKLETLMQAIELGVARVRTGNDEENAPILHLNHQLGYRPVPGLRLWIKPA